MRLLILSTTTAMTLVLSACGLDQYMEPIDDTGPIGNTDGDDTEVGEDEGKQKIELASITPEYVTTSGGHELTIIGGPFDSSATVRFNGSAGLVQEAQTNVLSVVTPSLPSPGSYKIEVTTNTGYGSREDALIVLEDGTGLGGTFGELVWQQYVGGYWSSGSVPSPEGWAAFGFISPTNFNYWEFFTTSMGSCTNGHTYSGTASIMDLGTNSVYLSNGSTSISLAWDASYGQFCSGGGCDQGSNIGSISSSQYHSGSVYELETVSPTNGWPEFSVPNLVKTPTGINVTNPAITGASLPILGRNQQFNWSAGSADYVLIQLWLLNDAQTSIEQDITCVTPNTGSFTIPSNAWTSYPTNRVVHVMVGAVQETTGVLPNGAETRMVGVNWLHGGGYTY